MRMKTKLVSFESLQDYWYNKLRAVGFQDIEDYKQADRPLKKWSGISIEVTEFVEIVSSEPVLRQEEHFLNHPDFDEFCRMICFHGNMSLTPKTLRLVWVDYCNGGSQRKIAAKNKTSDSTILRVLRKIREAMNLMGEEVEKILIRHYRPETDAACVYACWRNALWFDQKRPESEAVEFHKKANREIRATLKDATIKIAFPSNDDNHILGYAVLNEGILEWVYIKPDYRNQGIAKMLTKGFDFVSEPKTKVGIAIAKEKKLTIKENHGKTSKEDSSFRATNNSADSDANN